jgi:hypothetical protein
MALSEIVEFVAVFCFVCNIGWPSVYFVSIDWISGKGGTRQPKEIVSQ